MTEFRQVPDSREWKRGGSLLLRHVPVFLDPQLLDFRVQRRAGNSEFRCRTFWAGNFPFTFRKSRFNNFFFLILESVWQRTWQLLPSCLLAGQPSLIDPKSVAAAQDHRSLNDVLQLADISRPRI